MCDLRVDLVIIIPASNVYRLKVRRDQQHRDVGAETQFDTKPIEINRDRLYWQKAEAWNRTAIRNGWNCPTHASQHSWRHRTTVGIRPCSWPHQQLRSHSMRCESVNVPVECATSKPSIDQSSRASYYTHPSSAWWGFMHWWGGKDKKDNQG